MRRWLPILVALAGLGSLISCKRTPAVQAKPAIETPKPLVPASKTLQHETVPAAATLEAGQTDPFTRYLTVENAHGHQPALTRFAAECAVDLATANANYAQRPEETWNMVPDLSKAQDDQETDFYGTVAVLHQQGRILVEQWGMDLDTGDYYRLLYCLNMKQITLADSVSWRMAGFGESAGDASWGYEHRWKLRRTGKFDTEQTRFIDLDEKPIPAPKLDADTLNGLKEESVGVKTWADLGLPDVLLR